MATSFRQSPAFDPATWLQAFTAIGGGYALMYGRRLAFLVSDCDADDLTPAMAQIVGRLDRQEALKATIEQGAVVPARSHGEA